MNYSLFSEDMKLNDLVHANSGLLYVLSHFGIELGFGEKSIKQVCEQYQIDPPLFLFLCNLYSFDDFHPASSDLDNELVLGIVGYLENSHRNYRQYRLPKIISQITELEKYYDFNILTTFCEKLSKEVNDHFDYEEKIAFPSIIDLINENKNIRFKINRFKLAHRKMDAALNDLKNVLIKYVPEDYTHKRTKDIVLDIFSLENDFDKHMFLEEEILLMYVETLLNEGR